MVMWREFNLVNSFTCEASFAGPTIGSHSGCHFNQAIFEQMGHSFCETMFDMTENREGITDTV